jgi:outer membrane protein OmpA-like peptidoglycan-associated protein
MTRPMGIRRNPVPAIVVGVVGLLAIGIGQHVPNRHAIEDDLTARSVSALQSAGVVGAEVSFTGRDGAVRVASAADVDRAGGIVRAVRGVRVAEVVAPGGVPATAAVPATATSAAPATGTAGGTPTVGIAVDGGRVSVTGAVPSDAVRAALVAQLSATYGADKVDDRLTVVAGISDTGLSGIGAVAAALGADAQQATAELSGNRITLTGTVGSVAVEQAAVMAAGQVVGVTGPPVDRLTVAAPAPAVTPAPEVQRQLVALPRITFLNGSATLSPQGQSAVARAARLLTANPQVKVRIEGHTDSVGSASSNLALSRARAQEVVTTLRAMGVATNRMTSEGFGESRLKVRDRTAAQHAINRRVEFVVLP